MNMAVYAVSIFVFALSQAILIRRVRVVIESIVSFYRILTSILFIDYFLYLLIYYSIL